MKMKAKINSLNGSFSKQTKNILVGTLSALSFSLILVLVFAFLLKFTSIPDSAINPVNQIIKGVSVFAGVFIGLKKSKELGLVNGVLIGLFYTILAFLVFSILSGKFICDITFVTDIIFGAVIGGICGIICVNIKKTAN